MNITPMATASQQQLSTWDPEAAAAASAPVTAGARRSGGAGGQEEGEASGSGRGGVAVGESRSRVVLRFPSNPSEMLLSGTLVGGQTLVNRAQVVDISIGQGHLVAFAIRPFWRWQTQGTYFLGFNAILNWNDLDAGR